MPMRCLAFVRALDILELCRQLELLDVCWCMVELCRQLELLVRQLELLVRQLVLNEFRRQRGSAPQRRALRVLLLSTQFLLFESCSTTSRQTSSDECSFEFALKFLYENFERAGPGTGPGPEQVSAPLARFVLALGSARSAVAGCGAVLIDVVSRSSKMSSLSWISSNFAKFVTTANSKVVSC